MHIDKITAQNNNNNINFGAIFKVNKLADSASEVVLDAVKSCTIPEETQKIQNKFSIGGGELFVFVPNENLQKLLKLLNSRLAHECIAKYLTKVD